MAIRIIKKGELTCDRCKKVLAKVTASREVFEALEKEEKFVEIQCYNCEPEKL